MGDGTRTWSQLEYFANAAELTAAIESVVGMAPETLNTLSEIATALGNDEDFLSALATNARVDDVVLGATAALQTAAGNASTALSSHSSNTLNVHGIANTAQLATLSNVETAKSEAISTATTDAQARVSNAVSALTKSSVGLGNVNNTADLDKPVSTAQATAISTAITDAVTESLGETDNKIADHATIETNVHGITDAANLAYFADLDEAVSDHNALTQNIHGIANTANLALKSDVAAVTKATIGLASVDNTADASKPVSTAQAAAIATAKTEAITAAGSAADTKVSTHNLGTTNVHGIADTAQLVTQSDLSSALSGATVDQSSLAGVGIDWNAVNEQFDIDSTIATKTYANNAVSTHEADTTSVHGIANTADLLLKSGGTMTGALTLSGAPTSDLHAATKQYVDGLAAGINFHQPVIAATAGNLAGVYDNGTNGVGATLTASANGSIGTIDGASVSVGNRVLLRAQTDATQNGIYTVTNVGGASTKWVVTRAVDADNNPAGELANGDFCFVTSGSTNGSKGFILSTTGTITIGTTNVNYSQFNASEALTAGTNITRSGSTISVADAPTFSGAITASAGVTFSDGTQTKVGVPSVTTIATEITSSTTLSAGQTDKFIPLNGAVQITLPATGYSTGQSIDFWQSTGTGASFASTNGVVGTPGYKFRTTNSVVTAMKTAAGWLIFGDLAL
jgi:hypothetical protein